MITLFDQEYATRMMKEEAHQEGRKEGIQEGMQRGVQKGMQKGVLNSLRSLIAATGWPLEQAMTTLSIPEAERPAYRKILQQ